MLSDLKGQDLLLKVCVAFPAMKVVFHDLIESELISLRYQMDNILETSVDINTRFEILTSLVCSR